MVSLLFKLVLLLNSTIFGVKYFEIAFGFPMTVSTEETELCYQNLNRGNTTQTKWYRFHNETQRCYHVDEREPCGQLMLFYRVGNTQYGDCDCNFYYRCGRPLIYWKKPNRCYFVNDQGPCNTNEWLVFNDNGTAECQQSACAFEQASAPSTPTSFWFESNGTCYRTGTNGYCANSKDILSVKWEDYKPTCNSNIECNPSGRVVTALSCLPGQRHDANGNCKKVMVIS